MIKTIEWKDNKLKIIDQTKLPGQVVFIELSDVYQVGEAIKRLAVRGAPAIGIAAAYGVVLGMKASKLDSYLEFSRKLEEVINYLGSSRPTAVNLFWALKRMNKAAEQNKTEDLNSLNQLLLTEANTIFYEDLEMGRKIGECGNSLLQDGNVVLTHCNAGGLATSGYGTALAPIFLACEKGKQIKVYADETRPLLQGARLTVWELMNQGIEVTLICDNMAAFVMKQGKVDMVIVGADRIAGNGDTANKIGTYGLAVLAQKHKVPFYVAAPKSTFDLSLTSGAGIPIEERSAEEVTCGFGKRTAPLDARVYAPAFDVTEAEFIKAFITEAGLIYPPFSENIRKVLNLA